MYIKHRFNKFKNLYTFIQIILSESFFNRIFLIGLRAQYNKPITLRSKKKNEDFFHQTYAFGRNDTHIILNGTLAKWRISHQESTNRVKNLLDRSVEGEMLRCCSACFRDLSHAFEMTGLSFWTERERSEESQTNSTGFLVGLSASLGMPKGCRPWKRMSFWRP